MFPTDQNFKWYSKYKLKILNNDKYPIVSIDGNQLLFIHINKTAGTSILNAIGKCKFHLTVKEGINLLGEKKFKECHKFTVVRNPYMRTYSMYKHRCKTNQSNMRVSKISFSDWVDKCFSEPTDSFYRDRQYKMFYPQVEWLKDWNGDMRFDTIIHFENINAEWSKFAEKYKLPTEIEHLNSTQSYKEDLSDIYDEKSKKIISAYFAEDFEVFGYNV